MARTSNSADDAYDASRDETVIAQVYRWARNIPIGRVISYGELGKLCEPPISGFICGKIMNRAIQDVPWWRVVGKEGNLPIAKRSPHLAVEQRERLEEEDVTFEGECVLMSKHAWKPEQ